MNSLCRRHTSLYFIKKSFSTSENTFKSHYDSLGITSKATQNDIKAAYYKLSKLYHPDKNKASKDAADKFRDITAAYEVLGNLKTRKMYDKGIFYVPDSVQNPDLNSQMADTYEHARFYHSRNVTNRRNSEAGLKTPIYDFDQWTRNHYGATFNRRTEAKNKYDNLSSNNPDVLADDQKHAFSKVAIGFILLSFLLFEFTFNSGVDTADKRYVKNNVDK